MKYLRGVGMLAGALLAVSLAKGATIAQWNFEQGEGGVTPTNGQSFASLAALSTPNGYLMHGYTDVLGASYSSQTVDGSAFSLRANGSQDGYTTDTAFNQFSPPQWTIECAIKLDSVSGWRTFIGKDGSSFGSAGSDFYLQKNNDNQAFRLSCRTKSGESIAIDSNFIPAANQWYGLALVSDGTNVIMYANKQDGMGWQDVGSYAFSNGGSDVATNALAGGSFNWTFMRGWYNNKSADNVAGNMDNVRFSDAALTTNDFLYFPNTVTTPPDAPIANKLWINGTTAKLYWSASSTATNYVVNRTLESGINYSVVGQTPSTYYFDSNLVSGTTYYYAIAGQNANGEGGLSTELSGTATNFTIISDGGGTYQSSIYTMPEAVADGDTNTYYDALDPSGWVGLDLGAGNAQTIPAIDYYPRAGLESRLDGGEFQGSNDGTTWTTLYTIPSGTTLAWHRA